MTEYERRFLERLVSNLRTLQEEIRAIREYQQARDDAADDKPIEPLQIEIAHAPELDPARREHYESENRERNSRWSTAKRWGEAIAVVTALGLLMVNYFQLRSTEKAAQAAADATRISRDIRDDSEVYSAATLLQMERQSSSMRESARATQQSNKITAKALEVSERPWLVVDNPRVPENEVLWFDKNRILTTIQMDTKNIGHSPAMNVWAHLMLHYGGGAMADLTRSICERNGAPPINSGFGEVIFPGNSAKPVSYPISLSNTEIAEYWAAPSISPLDVAGCVAYHSPVSKELYYTGFVYTIYPPHYPAGPAPSVAIKIPGREITLLPQELGFVVR